MKTTKKTKINKMGYSIFVGILCLAYISEIEPLKGGIFFLVGFICTFISIALLEVIYEFSSNRSV